MYVNLISFKTFSGCCLSQAPRDSELVILFADIGVRRRRVAEEVGVRVENRVGHLVQIFSRLDPGLVGDLIQAEGLRILVPGLK